MGFLSLFISITVMGLVGHGPRQAVGKNSNSPESIFHSYQFPSHPNLTHLCQERVYSSSGHEITWDIFASPVKPSKLVAYYRRKLGDAGFTREGGGGRWSLPADAPRPERVLEVSGVGADNPSRQCEKRPPANTRAIILLSRREGHQIVPAEPPPDNGLHTTRDTAAVVKLRRAGGRVRPGVRRLS